MARKKYIRTCACGDVKEVGYKPKPNTKCMSCSAKVLGKNMAKSRWAKVKERKTYTYFCPTCPSVRILNARRTSSMCGDCSRIYSKRPKPTASHFDFKDMKMTIMKPAKRYFRLCIDCGDCKQVATASAAKPNYCRKCSDKNKDRKAISAKGVATIKKATKPRKKTVKKKVSKEAIEKQIQLNREHREFHENEVKEIPEQSTSNEDMIARFLKKKKPSVTVDMSVPMPHFIGLRMECS